MSEQYDLIDRKALLDRIRKGVVLDETEKAFLIGAVNSVPTIEPHVVRGKWVKKETDAGTLAMCNQCNHPISWWHKSKFCPNCGSKNKGVEI